MNKTLRRLRREIERRGGVVHIEPNLPDEVAELFLREILDCPDCMAEARRRDATESRQDAILAEVVGTEH